MAWRPYDSFGRGLQKRSPKGKSAKRDDDGDDDDDDGPKSGPGGKGQGPPSSKPGGGPKGQNGPPGPPSAPAIGLPGPLQSPAPSTTMTTETTPLPTLAPPSAPTTQTTPPPPAPTTSTTPPPAPTTQTTPPPPATTYTPPPPPASTPSSTTQVIALPIMDPSAPGASSTPDATFTVAPSTTTPAPNPTTQPTTNTIVPGPATTAQSQSSPMQQPISVSPSAVNPSTASMTTPIQMTTSNGLLQTTTTTTNTNSRATTEMTSDITFLTTTSYSSTPSSSTPPPIPTLIPAAEMNNGTSSLSTGAKIGIGVGVSIFGLLAFLALGFCLWRRRKQSKDAAETKQIFSEYDPQYVYFGDGGEAGKARVQAGSTAAAMKQVRADGPLPPQPAATATSRNVGAAYGDPFADSNSYERVAVAGGMGMDIGMGNRGYGYAELQGDDRPFSFRSADGRTEERMMAPGLREHPVGTRNTLEDLGFPFARRISDSTSFSSDESGGAQDGLQQGQGPLYIIGGGTIRRNSAGRGGDNDADSLMDPETPFRTRSPSPNEIGIGRPSITPSESISRIMMGPSNGYPSLTPSESISRIGIGESSRSRTPSATLSRLLGRKSGQTALTAAEAETGQRSSSNSDSKNTTISIAELPKRPEPAATSNSPQTPISSSSKSSWPMPPGGLGLKAWLEMMRPKIRTQDPEMSMNKSRWSETQRSNTESARLSRSTESILGMANNTMGTRSSRSGGGESSSNDSREELMGVTALPVRILPVSPQAQMRRSFGAAGTVGLGIRESPSPSRAARERARTSMAPAGGSVLNIYRPAATGTARTSATFPSDEANDGSNENSSREELATALPDIRERRDTAF